MSIFNDWNTKLDEFESAAKANDIANIQEKKRAAHDGEDSAIADKKLGRIIRDDTRIILSAPEIVIGNVAKDGTLLGGGSIVVIRGNNVNLEAEGQSGMVMTRANNVIQIAENPGIDGLEHSVTKDGRIANIASSVTMHASSNVGTYYDMPDMSPGLHLHSDTNLDVNAGIPRKRSIESITNLLTSLNNMKQAKENLATELRDKMKKVMKGLDDAYSSTEKLSSGDVSNLRTNTGDLTMLNERFNTLSRSLAKYTERYLVAVSSLGEINVSIKNLSDAKTNLENMKDDNIPSAEVSVGGKTIKLESKDGNGNVIPTAEGNISLNAAAVNVKSNDSDGNSIAGSTFKVNTQDILLDTREYTVTDKDNKKGSYKIGDGRFIVNAKESDILAYDCDVENGDEKEGTRKLVEGSSVNFRTQHFCADSSNDKGQSTGSVILNSKQFVLKSVDTEKNEEKGITEGSTMQLQCETIEVGKKKDDKYLTKNLTMLSDTITEESKTCGTIQQAGTKAKIEIKEGKLNISGAENTITGKTTLNAVVEIAGDASVKGKINAQNDLQVTGQIKNNFLESGPSVGPGAKPGEAENVDGVKNDDLIEQILATEVTAVDTQKKE